VCPRSCPEVRQPGLASPEAGVDRIAAHRLDEVDRGEGWRRDPYVPDEDHMFEVDTATLEAIAVRVGNAPPERHIDDVHREGRPKRHARCRRTCHHRSRIPRGDRLHPRGEVVNEFPGHVRAGQQPHDPPRGEGAGERALLGLWERGPAQHRTRGGKERLDLHA